MKEQNYNTPQNGGEEEAVDLRAFMLKLLIIWPWFLASVLVCTIGMYVYLRFQPPVYEVTSSVLIKDEDKKGEGSNPLSVMQDMGMVSMTSLFDNEIEILKSRTLIKRVVEDLGLYILHKTDRTGRYDVPLYGNCPVTVYMTPKEAGALLKPVTVTMDYAGGGRLKAEIRYYSALTDEMVTQEAGFDRLPAVLPTPAGVLNFSGPEDKGLDVPGRYMARIVSPAAAAQQCAGALSVTPTSRTTTIARISFKDCNPRRGIDFINGLVEFYNLDANEEKNMVAQKTADFIQDRIAIINHDLGITESQLADFKQKSGLTNLTSDAQMALQENSKYEQMRIENTTQISLLKFLKDYINNPANREEVIPANVGLKDHNLTAVIEEYNGMIIERKRLLRTSSENNPAVITLNTGIEAMQRTVLTTVNSVMQGLEITRKDLERQTRKFGSRISAAPRQEKEFMNIQRQQELQSSLYTMLLQKREENAITLEATANNGRIIEEPMSGTAPVAPKKNLMLLAAFVLGLGLPLGYLWLREFLKYRIENRKDVEAITDVPVLAEIPKVQTAGQGSVVVRENRNGMVEELFRSLRTNLLFMLEKDEKVIMLSSGLSGEGKSFVAANLAVSMAFLKKKVILVGLDIRKPGLDRIFGFPQKVEGITGYLADPDRTDLFSLIRKSGVNPCLDVLPGGPVPPNPTELVSADSLDRAIALLKERYDYIILDTAPVTQITDTAIISRVADACLYICRADFTTKAAFAFINTLAGRMKFPKLAVAINAIDMKKRKHRYGYSYGKRYGYGKGYGYGYGYGYHYGEEKNNK